jgi:hypothetical protein
VHRSAASLLVVLVVAGCLGPSAAVAPDPTATPADVPERILFEGAEDAKTKWDARTWISLLGDDPRPDVGRWHRSTKVMRSGQASWTFQDESVGRYHDGTRYDLHSPDIDLGQATNPVWRFHYRGDSEIRSGDEFSWMIGNDGGGFLSLGSTDAPVADWKEVSVNLTAYAGQKIQLLYRFVADGCGGDTPVAPLCGDGTFSGYFVDDIEIFDAGRDAR